MIQVTNSPCIFRHPPHNNPRTKKSRRALCTTREGKSKSLSNFGAAAGYE